MTCAPSDRCPECGRGGGGSGGLTAQQRVGASSAAGAQEQDAVLRLQLFVGPGCDDARAAARDADQLAPVSRRR